MLHAVAYVMRHDTITRRGGDIIVVLVKVHFQPSRKRLLSPINTCATAGISVRLLLLAPLTSAESKSGPVYLLSQHAHFRLIRLTRKPVGEGQNLHQ